MDEAPRTDLRVPTTSFISEAFIVMPALAGIRFSRAPMKPQMPGSKSGYRVRPARQAALFHAGRSLRRHIILACEECGCRT
jgi:hypothetical protein